MKANDSISSKFNDGCTPEHDALVFEAEAYFRKIFKVTKVSYEVPVLAGNGFVVGYIDILVEVDYFKYAVEVKPAINSFGALIRQLNTYSLNGRRLGNPVFCVYTHDQEYTAQIESQGYVCYPKPTKKKSKTK